MKKFKELFEKEKSRAMVVKAPDSIFLSYPKDVIFDIEDKFGDIIDDYEIKGDKVTIYFSLVPTPSDQSKIASMIQQKL